MHPFVIFSILLVLFAAVLTLLVYLSDKKEKHLTSPAKN